MSQYGFTPQCTSCAGQCNCNPPPFNPNYPPDHHHHHGPGGGSHWPPPPHGGPGYPDSGFHPHPPYPGPPGCSYYWVDAYHGSGVPHNAVHGGNDVDGQPIYVGRAYHEGDWVPAKVIPGRNVTYISWNGQEHPKDRFQVLIGQHHVHWIPDSSGRVPPHAIEGGKTKEGETLYIGRVHHGGALTVGKVHCSHRVCYIPFDGRELPFPSYEVLVARY